MEHFKGINDTERYNNDLLNEIRKTNQLLEQLISNTESNPRSDKREISRQQQTGGNKRNAK